jgi:hypothetical protein
VYASFYLDASTGGCIVVVQALLFLGVLVFGPRRGLLARARSRHHRGRGAATLAPPL